MRELGSERTNRQKRTPLGLDSMTESSRFQTTGVGTSRVSWNRVFSEYVVQEVFSRKGVSGVVHTPF